MDRQTRDAVVQDVQGLIDLSLRTIRASYQDFLGESVVEDYIRSGEVEAFVRKNMAHALVVTHGDELAGYAVATDNHIEQLIIDERFHRRGIGSFLLEHLERELFKDHDELVLESFRDNDRANDFYLAHGWLVGGAFHEEVYGIAMITLRKKAQ